MVRRRPLDEGAFKEAFSSGPVYNNDAEGMNKIDHSVVTATDA